MKKYSFKIFSIIVFIIAIFLLTIIAAPLIKSYNNPDEFSAFIEGFGTLGFILMLFIQIAQIIVAIIPGEVVEFVAGTLYGWFGGLLFCLTGIAIGQILIFVAVRFFGKSLVDKAAGSKAMQKYKFLKDEKRLKTVIFILYFIPGTPKDLLTYAVPMTKISLQDFIIISLLARIPSIVTSTYAGDAFSNKDFVSLIITYAFILFISIGGVITYRCWEARREAKNVDKGQIN